jgi:hypothetical protein
MEAELMRRQHSLSHLLFLSQQLSQILRACFNLHYQRHIFESCLSVHVSARM